jgi:CHAD domain-containing protein
MVRPYANLGQSSIESFETALLNGTCSLYPQSSPSQRMGHICKRRTEMVHQHDDADRARGPQLGLSYWMERVVEETDGACRELSADRVHDLRVALRRCRSMAEGFMALDPDPAWRALQKEGRQLFKRLGRLRDVQVLQQWVGELAEPGDPVSAAMLFHLRRSEGELKGAALAAVQNFNRDKWRGRIRRLHSRARRLPPSGAVFQLTALQAWNSVREHHRKALRDRTPKAWHRLRIAIKRFRYTVENFLPLRHTEWGGDLKEIQDGLGEAQDLFVFWQTAIRFRVFPDMETRERWRARVELERARRIDGYRTKMVGSNSLLGIWRTGLPNEKRLPSMSLRIVEKWAFFHRLDLARARRVRSLSLQLFDGLHNKKAVDVDYRRQILHLAAILHEFGRAKANKRGSGSAERLMRRLPPLPGFPADSLMCAVIIILGHRGKFRSFEMEEFASLPEGQRRIVMELCGILRLARVLALDVGEKIESLEVEQTPNSILISAAGYSEMGPLAEKAAQARHLLEVACRRPVMIRNAQPGPGTQ